MKYLISVLIGLLIFISCMYSCNVKNQETKTDAQTVAAPEDPGSNQETSVPAEPNAADPDVLMADITPDILIGRWLRPDGNYIIQIDKIIDDKTIEARYFNPRPIHIARAEILNAEGLRIYIEFHDVGYEGSSYDLRYDPENDALTGNYFQATYGQTYQIGFIRMDN